MIARNAPSYNALDFECMPLQVRGSDRLIEGMEKIAANRERVHSQMIEAAARAGRAADDLRLIAISRTHVAATIRSHRPAQPSTR